MKYWDASGIVPLLVRQARTQHVARVLEQDPEVATWWATPLECYSAIMRLIREGRLGADEAQDAERRLHALRNGWYEILPSEACRQTAERMLRVHPLRAGDALQLAAALIASDHDPRRLDVVCLDDVIAETFQRLAHGMRIAQRLSQLLLRRQIVVFVDSDDEGHTLGGKGSRRKGKQTSASKEEPYWCAAHVPLPGQDGGCCPS